LRAFRWAPGSGELLDIGVERDGPVIKFRISVSRTVGDFFSIRDKQVVFLNIN
jgi:hypothetical protein